MASTRCVRLSIMARPAVVSRCRSCCQAARSARRAFACGASTGDGPALGFGSLKLKAGVLPPDEEVRTIELLREAFGPDVPLRIDPNTAWSLDTSLRYAPKLQGLLEYFEDSVAGKEDMAALARACNIPLATNMCCMSFADLPRTIELGSVSIILGDQHL
jgi:L-alanine-DL-glutamate epimerase-like enolase superfamily enzyme